jgi:hypothetical protein
MNYINEPTARRSHRDEKVQKQTHRGSGEQTSKRAMTIGLLGDIRHRVRANLRWTAASTGPAFDQLSP